MKRIYESILDDMTADDRSQSNELRRATQDSTYVAGEGEPYDKFFVRVRFRLTDVPATPEYNYRFDRVIENVQAVLDANRYVTGYSEIFFTSNDGRGSRTVWATRERRYVKTTGAGPPSCSLTMRSR